MEKIFGTEKVYDEYDGKVVRAIKEAEMHSILEGVVYYVDNDLKSFDQNSNILLIENNNTDVVDILRGLLAREVGAHDRSNFQRWWGLEKTAHDIVCLLRSEGIRAVVEYHKQEVNELADSITDYCKKEHVGLIRPPKEDRMVKSFSNIEIGGLYSNKKIYTAVKGLEIPHNRLMRCIAPRSDSVNKQLLGELLHMNGEWKDHMVDSFTTRGVAPSRFIREVRKCAKDIRTGNLPNLTEEDKKLTEEDMDSLRRIDAFIEFGESYRDSGRRSPCIVGEKAIVEPEIRLVTEKWVDGPRVMTLAGLQRRGVTSTSINAFIQELGITRSDNSLIHLSRLENHIGEELNKTAPRTMVVLNPLKVVITNMDDAAVMDLDAKKWPDARADDASSFYKVPFSKVVYIEQSDFRLKDSRDYHGLAPEKSVFLRHAFPIKCTGVIFGDDNETVHEIRAEYDPYKKTKPEGVLHWVSESSPGVNPLKVEVRLFDKLFNYESPAELDDRVGDLNPDPKVVSMDAYAVPSVKNAAVGDIFQFEGLGYFVVDPDSTPEKLVFNRTITLFDNYGKQG